MVRGAGRIQERCPYSGNRRSTPPIRRIVTAHVRWATHALGASVRRSAADCERARRRLRRRRSDGGKRGGHAAGRWGGWEEARRGQPGGGGRTLGGVGLA